MSVVKKSLRCFSNMSKKRLKDIFNNFFFLGIRDILIFRINLFKKKRNIINAFSFENFFQKISTGLYLLEIVRSVPSKHVSSAVSLLRPRKGPTPIFYISADTMPSRGLNWLACRRHCTRQTSARNTNR